MHLQKNAINADNKIRQIPTSFSCIKDDNKYIRVSDIDKKKYGKAN
jgi:hypothetical protein